MIDKSSGFLVRDSVPENHSGTCGEVLVAIMNNRYDFALAHDRHWYRIPVRSVDYFLKQRWPPRWLAFYQTRVFGNEAYAVRYYASVLDIQRVFRWQLFPEEPQGDKTEKQYWQLFLSPLKKLPIPIFSRRLRRIVFIPTTWDKLINAVEINDLYDQSPLEDHLWATFKRFEIPAERQFFVRAGNQRYALDFAIFCDQGQVDVEADGDMWHSTRAHRARDYIRNNHLGSLGWSVVRFTGHQIRERTAEYCVPTVMSCINQQGGLTTAGIMPRKFDPENPDGPRQLALFEEDVEYEID